jgi:hypothetical protein
MFTRSIMLALAVGFVGMGTASANPNFECANSSSVQVACVGDVAVLPITVLIKDVSILDDSQLSVLSDDLNKVSILNGDILDKNTILNNVEASVLTDFLDKFNIDVTKNDIDVCTSVLGFLLCK